MPRRKGLLSWGCAPRSAFGLTFRAEPEPRASPICLVLANGGAEPSPHIRRRSRNGPASTFCAKPERSVHAAVLFLPTIASQISFAETRTAIVNPKNGPKSCIAGMLVMKSPGTDVCR